MIHRHPDGNCYHSIDLQWPPLPLAVGTELSSCPRHPARGWEFSSPESPEGLENSSRVHLKWMHFTISDNFRVRLFFLHFWNMTNHQRPQKKCWTTVDCATHPFVYDDINGCSAVVRLGGVSQVALERRLDLVTVENWNFWCWLDFVVE